MQFSKANRVLTVRNALAREYALLIKQSSQESFPRQLNLTILLASQADNNTGGPYFVRQIVSAETYTE